MGRFGMTRNRAKNPGDGAWSRLFGYDVFVSFALGARPRGTRAYASDLTRRLRERGFTVYFSEDQTRPGVELDPALKSGLRASRSVVVVANRATLIDPRWVKKEVETFRQMHPKRNVVALNVDGAMQDPTLADAAKGWLPSADHVWIDETMEAEESGVVSDSVVERLVIVPRAVRSTVRLRAVVTFLLLLFAVLTVAAVWQKNIAVAAAREAVRRRVAVETSEIMQGSRSGTTEQAMLRAAAISALAPGIPNGGILDHLNAFPGLLKIIDTGSPVEALSMSPDGTQIAVGGGTNNFSLMRADTLERLSGSPSCPGNNVLGVAFSPDGSRVAVANADGTAEIVSDEAGREGSVWFQVMDMHVIDVAFSPDGMRVLAGGSGGLLRLWNATSGAPTSPFLGTDGSDVLKVAFGLNGLAASSDASGTVTLWDTTLPVPMPKTLQRHGIGITPLAFDSSGAWVASGGRDRKIRRWDLRSDKELPPLDNAGAVTSLAIQQGGNRMIVGDVLGQVTIWEKVGSDEWKAGQSFAAHKGSVNSIVIDAPRMRFVTGGADGTVRVWRLEPSSVPQPVNQGDEFQTCAFSSQKDHAVCSGNAAETLTIVNLRDGTSTSLSRGGATYAVDSLAYSPNGLIIAAGSREGFIDLLDSKTGEEKGHYFGGSVGRSIQDILFIDATHFVSAGLGSALLWELGKATPVGRLDSGRDGYVKQLALSPDRTRVAGASERGFVVVWDIKTRLPVGPMLKDGRPLTSVAYSPDGSSVVAGGSNGTLRSWRVATGELILHPVQVHTGVVQHVLYGPMGTSIVSSDTDDDTVRLWDAKSGEPLGAPSPSHDSRIIGASLDPRQESILAINSSKALRVVPGPQKWKGMLCSRLARNMTLAEWDLWISPDVDYEVQCEGLAAPSRTGSTLSVLFESIGGYLSERVASSEVPARYCPRGPGQASSRPLPVPPYQVRKRGCCTDVVIFSRRGTLEEVRSHGRSKNLPNPTFESIVPDVSVRSADNR